MFLFFFGKQLLYTNAAYIPCTGFNKLDYYYINNIHRHILVLYPILYFKSVLPAFKFTAIKMTSHPLVNLHGCG